MVFRLSMNLIFSYLAREKQRLGSELYLNFLVCVDSSRPICDLLEFVAGNFDKTNFIRFEVACCAIWEDRNKVYANCPLPPMGFKVEWMMIF